MRTKKHKGRGQSGRLSTTPDSTACCFCGQKKSKMIVVQICGSNRCWPACAECRKTHDGQWKHPR